MNIFVAVVIEVVATAVAVEVATFGTTVQSICPKTKTLMQIVFLVIINALSA